MFLFRVLAVAALASSAWAAKQPDWNDLRMRIRTVLHVPDPLPTLREKGYGQFTVAPDVVADRVSYATGYGLRVPALVYHAPGATVVQHPAVIVVSSRDGDKASRDAYLTGILYSRAGAVVLTYDPIGQYERNSERRSAALPAPAGAMADRLAGFMVTDVMQAVQYLNSRKDVDPKRIAVLGFSSGASIAALACAVDPIIHACVLAAGDLSRLDNLREETWKMVGTSKTVFQSGKILSRPVALWLNNKLKFPNWTKKQIAALPEKDWGSDVPGVARENLHAVPDVVWAAEKEYFTYESWLERAQTAETWPAGLKVR